MRGTLIAIVMVSLALSSSAAQSPVTAFKGRPSMKISEGGVERAPENITPDRAINLECNRPWPKPKGPSDPKLRELMRPRSLRGPLRPRSLSRGR